ncbi:MAG: peptide chain release factor 2 [Methylocella sp.]
MRAEAEALVQSIKQSIGLLRRHLDVDTAARRLAELNAKAGDPNLWNDTEAAQQIMRERTALEDRLGSLNRFENELLDAITLVELAEAEQDEVFAREGLDQLKALKAEAGRRQIEALLSGEADANDTYIEVHAGAGGTESCDWARMLFRMYARWAERHKYKVEIIEETAGDEAGLKSGTLLVKGHNAHGWAKTESGVHRLVRISPFDANARRHTSFASVWVYPAIDDRIAIEVTESDCRIDTYRSSGAGGQHVNTTDSAVRITHIPSGIVVACQGERSQHKNRATAWNMLRARLYEQEIEKREAAANATEAAKTEIGWGHQIRSYVLQPYQLVKDLRTGATSGTPSDVLDGALDRFMEAALAQKLSGGGPAAVEDVE